MIEKEISQKRPLYDIFTTVPPHYDFINRIFTGGLDERWRRLTARMCLSSKPERVLDLCCGTGDLARWLARFAPATTEIIGLDYSLPMLVRAEEKVRRFSFKARLSLVNGDVDDLPFPDEFFDSIAISFAFRNLTYKNPKTGSYLAEVIRVLKPGGKFVIVESSQPPNRLIRKIAHLYLRLFVYRLGYWISKNRPAYEYLSESARNFYTSEELADLLINTGFSRVIVKRLFFGAAAIHLAVK